MTGISVWKRMGGWFRRSQVPVGGDRMIPLNADGMILNSQEGSTTEGHHSTALFARPRKKENQLVAMEEGFNRLVEVLEAINENVSGQRQESERLRERLDQLVEVSKTVPGSLDKQAGMMEGIFAALREQSGQTEKMTELMQSVPELTAEQVAKLTEILEQMENSSQSTAAMAESFEGFNSTLQGVSTNTSAQTTALHSVADLLERNDQRMEQMLTTHRRRFWWILGVVGVGVVVAVLAVLWAAMRGGAG